MKILKIIAILLPFLIFFTGCMNPDVTQTGDEQVRLPTITAIPTTVTVEETEEIVQTPLDTPVPITGTPEPMEDSTEFLKPLPPEPLRIEFEADDGVMLVGLYYPAAVNPAPLVVLHHWARGDKSNWLKLGMVQWLTNRGLILDELEMSQDDYYTLYPPMPDGTSFGVFVYDFRGFGESELENKWYPEGWRMDAQAAMKIAQQLPGVDTSRIASIGSSIGADGSVIGCLQGCSGAISFSPGNYLTRNYSDVVLELEQMGVPVLCFAAEGDGEAAPTCRNSVGSLYNFVIYPDSAHGNDLLIPGRVPEIGQTIRDFLLEVFQISE